MKMNYILLIFHQYKSFLLFLAFVFLFVTLSSYRLFLNKNNFISFKTIQKGVYLTEIDTTKCPNCIDFYVSDSLEIVESVAKKTNSIFAINGGFFDPVNKKTISYVVKNGKTVLNPEKNENLVSNPELKRLLPKILNRSEFRILKCSEGQIKFDIVQHFTPSDPCCRIMHSIQAGPEIYPYLNLEKEAFIVKEKGKIIRGSADVLKKSARSAIGIKDNKIIFLFVSRENPLSLKEVNKIFESIGAKKAMALDGGSSSSLYVNIPGKKRIILNSAKDSEARKVKSIILIR